MLTSLQHTSCKQSFIALKILTLSSLYIYSLLCFVVDNMDQYYFVSDIHSRKIKQVFNLNLYQPQPTYRYIKKAHIIWASNYSIIYH
jgi:hypothetical protein